MVQHPVGEWLVRQQQKNVGMAGLAIKRTPAGKVFAAKSLQICKDVFAFGDIARQPRATGDGNCSGHQERKFADAFGAVAISAHDKGVAQLAGPRAIDRVFGQAPAFGTGKPDALGGGRGSSAKVLQNAASLAFDVASEPAHLHFKDIDAVAFGFDFGHTPSASARAMSRSK